MHTNHPRPETPGAVSRRGLLKGAAVLAAAHSTPAFAQGKGNSGPILAYVGTYTPNGQGIYLFEVDPKTGTLTQRKVFASTTNPSWLAFDPSRTHLYSANEISNFNGTTTGSVSAYSINRSNGDLTLLNTVSSQGSGPAHLSVHPSGKFVLVANYGGGNVAVLPIIANGALGNATDVQADVGPVGPTHAVDAPPGSFAISGHDAPHAHMIQSDPAGKFVFVADLGLDRVFIWKLDLATGKLTPNTTPFVQTSPGAGPRHFAFHPKNNWFYLLNEEASTLSFYGFDPSAGTLTLQQTVSTLPPGFAGTNFTSEIMVSADGRFVYCANRLHDTIAFFFIDRTGAVILVGETSTLGDYPRNFNIDPTGSFMYTCNQRSDHIATFRMEGNGIRSTFADQYTPVGSPAIIIFLT